MSGTHHVLDHIGGGVRRRIGARGLMHRAGLLDASTGPLPSDPADVTRLLGAPNFRSQVRDLAGRLGQHILLRPATCGRCRLRTTRP